MEGERRSKRGIRVMPLRSSAPSPVYSQTRREKMSIDLVATLKSVEEIVYEAGAIVRKYHDQVDEIEWRGRMIR